MDINEIQGSLFTKEPESVYIVQCNEKITPDRVEDWKISQLDEESCNKKIEGQKFSDTIYKDKPEILDQLHHKDNLDKINDV